MMLGDFDMEMFNNECEHSHMAVALFCVYMAVVNVILLNLVTLPPFSNEY